MNATSKRYLTVFGALAVTLIFPFLLKPRGEKQQQLVAVSDKPLETLVVVTPHVESIRREFGLGFSAYMATQFSRKVTIQWLTPGGTSEIDRYLDTEYRAAFEGYWKAAGKPWTSDLAAVVGVAKAPDDWVPLKKEAREAFLKSDLGIKIDVFFGGGVYDFEKQKRKGYIVATDSSAKYGFTSIKAAHEDWFTEPVIPAAFAGDNYRDADLTWVGACLSSFGILYNQDVLDRKGISQPPSQWKNLAEPAYVGSIALADPSKSASAGKAFEMILQQEIQRSVASIKPPSDELNTAGTVRPPETREQAIKEGWARGLQLIQKIGANARYFTDAGPKPPADVSKGEAAAGMCIDFYGRAYVEKLAAQNQRSRVHYVVPEGGSAVSVDPIAMFRGAPSPELATKFLEFVLSKNGQRLWTYKVGQSGGPTRTALRRQPVRKDMYSPEELIHSSDPDVRPYLTTTFVYQPEYTAHLFNALRTVIRAMCIETHDELREAWLTMQAHNFPRQAMEKFENVTTAGYDKVSGDMVKIMSSSDKVAQARLARDLAASFRGNYILAKELAQKQH